MPSTNVVFMRLCSHISNPPHSLCLLFSRLLQQMPEPPHALHKLEKLLWRAILLAKTSFTPVVADTCAPAYLSQAHTLFLRLCWHIDAPSHCLPLPWMWVWGTPACLDLLLTRLCSHMCDLQHSLQSLLRRLWWQTPTHACLALAHKVVMLAYRCSAALFAAAALRWL